MVDRCIHADVYNGPSSSPGGGPSTGESLLQYVRDRLLTAVSRQRITVLPLVRPRTVEEAVLDGLVAASAI
jgi:hypothetical protein